MAVKIISVAKQLPQYFRETKDIIPFVKLWMQDQEERFQRKVIKLFEGAGVDKRYSIMSPEEVFTASSFVILPSFPVPFIVEVSIPFSANTFLAAGEAVPVA